MRNETRPTEVWSTDVGGGSVVSGAGSYGGMTEPAQDDTGLRPGGASLAPAPTSNFGTGAGAASARPGKAQGKAQYVQERYGGKEETGLSGDEVEAAPQGNSAAAALPSSPKVQHARGGGLMLVDDDA